MKAKALEIRDRGTFIPVLAVDMNPQRGNGFEQTQAQRYLLRRVGYACDGVPNVILTRLEGRGDATNDPYFWTVSSRTMQTAHAWIIEHWADLSDGAVVDVEFILGETPKPKLSERLTAGE